MPRIAWLLWALALAALILIPFAIWEEPLTAWVEQRLAQPSPRLATGALLAGLLAADIVLPTPSSLVSAGCGYLLGFAGGAAASWVGMTAGALLGYGLGRFAGRRVTRRFVGDEELDRAERLHRRWGVWFLAAGRATPVLAEATVFFAGVAGMGFARFAAVVSLANLGVSLAYAAVGAWALETESFLLAFAGAVVLPGLALWLARGMSRGNRSRG